MDEQTIVKPKRKTQPPSAEVVKRSHEKIYRQWSVKLRRVDDAELIAFIDKKISEGVSIANVLRELWNERNNKNSL